MSHENDPAFPCYRPNDYPPSAALGRDGEASDIPPAADRNGSASQALFGYSPHKLTLRERLAMARARLRHAAENGIRVRVYEVALDLDMSEFHFARQFRAAYGYSPHVYYDEVRAARGRDLLRQGLAAGDVARQIGLRRPAELRALLTRRQLMQSMLDVEPASILFPASLAVDHA
jgi:AraC-like DNA-binding protein